jgi:DNA-binding transcriptional ArsR family regulator
MPLAKLEVFDDALVSLSGFAKALSHPARLSILQHLAREKEMACQSIVDALPLSQAACSRHVAELVKAGLVKFRNHGNYVYYRIERKALSQFCKSMSAALHH